MSIFSSQTSWTGMCAGANQSPIHLSQGSAKPCKGTCDLKIDDTTPPSGNCATEENGLLVASESLGSCKFNNITYNAKMILINHPSHHTIEGVQADAEVVAYFFSPTGERLCVSSLIRVSSSPTPSLDFFKQVVAYASPLFPTKVNLTGWSLQQMVPADGSYYMYDGSVTFPPCMPCDWVVFKTMINMDQSDFALLVKNTQAGSRSIQALGSREIFYNDGADTGFLPHDNKTYLVMKPLNPQKKKPVLAKVDLKTTSATEAGKPSTTQQVAKHINDNWDAYIEGLFFIFFTGLVLFGLRYMYPKVNWLSQIYDWVKNTTGKKTSEPVS
jgi:carbonic anhydrase